MKKLKLFPKIFIEVLIYRYIKHCHHLIKGVEAGVLAVILVIHDGTGSPVNNIGQLLLRHPTGFSRPLDGKPYIVKIKSSFVLFYLHNITQCNFTFHVIVFERFIFSYYRLFNFTSWHGKMKMYLRYPNLTSTVLFNMLLL